MSDTTVYKCFTDTGIKQLITDIIGEEAALTVCTVASRSFERGVAALDRSQSDFARYIDEQRALHDDACDEAHTAPFCREAFRLLFSLRRNLRAYSKPSDEHTARIALIQLSRDYLNTVSYIAANSPATLRSPVYRALSERTVVSSDLIASLRKSLSHIDREIRSLPYLKLRLSSDGTAVTGCALSLTGRIPERNHSADDDNNDSMAISGTGSGTVRNSMAISGTGSGTVRSSMAISGTGSGIAELPAPFMIRLRTLRPELFRSTEDFYNTFRNILPDAVAALTADVDLIEYSLNFARLIGVLRKNNVPLCHPRISYDATDLTGACDISLLLLRRTNLNRSVVPNNVMLRRGDTVLLQGVGGSGKTSYMRALASCHMMFMLGVLVPAVFGRMLPMRDIVTHRISSDDNGDTSLPNVASLTDKSNALLLIADRSDDASGVAAAGLLHGSLDSAASHNNVCIVCSRHDVDEVENVSLLLSERDRNGKCTFRINAVSRGEDSRASEIVSRYGLDKSSLFTRFRNIYTRYGRGGDNS